LLDNLEQHRRFGGPLVLVAHGETQHKLTGAQCRRVDGKRAGLLGGWSAAHATSLDVRLITHNVKEFGKIPGLRIEDWT
jgi:tRNA(fMet)-specific endonuclease VapC